AGTADTHTVNVAWGDGGTASVALAAGVTSATATHVYADDNPTGTAQDTMSVSVTVTDDDGGSVSGTVPVVVNDVAPAVTGFSVSPATVAEGGTVTITVTFTDASSLDTFTAAVTWGGASTATGTS